MFNQSSVRLLVLVSNFKARLGLSILSISLSLDRIFKSRQVLVLGKTIVGLGLN